MQRKTAAIHRGFLWTLGIVALIAVVIVLMYRKRTDFSSPDRIATLGNHRFFSAGQLLNVEVKEENQRRTVVVTDFRSQVATALKKDFELQPDWHIEFHQDMQIIVYVVEGREYIWDFAGPVSKTYERKR
jgi:hypothetical protein